MNGTETVICGIIIFAVWLIQLAPRKAPPYGAESLGTAWRNKAKTKTL